MDFYVVLERAGYRVARRRRCCNKIGHQHKLTKEDAMAWFQRSFEVRFGRTPGDALPLGRRVAAVTMLARLPAGVLTSLRALQGIILSAFASPSLLGGASPFPFLS
jgi:hypothetical protein